MFCKCGCTISIFFSLLLNQQNVIYRNSTVSNLFVLIFLLGISAINPRFASPIKLSGVDCTPYDMYIPKCNEELATNSLTHCCQELFDKDAWPEQTVTSPENYVILFFASLFFLILRLLFWRFVYTSKRGHSVVSSSDTRFWLLTLWDQYVTMMIISVFAGLITNYSKLLIGAPRPCYYALQIFSSIHENDREHLNCK